MIWNYQEKAETSGPLTSRPGTSSGGNKSPPLFPAFLVPFTFLLLSGFSYIWLCRRGSGRWPCGHQTSCSTWCSTPTVSHSWVPLSSAALLKIGCLRFLWREQLWASLTSLLLCWNNHVPKIGKTSQRQHLFMQLFNVQKLNIFMSRLHIYIFVYLFFYLASK